MLAKANLPVPMPDADHDLIGMMDELGWCEAGAVPLSAREIAAWCGLMQAPLTPWEASMLRRMSEAFCAGTRDERAPYEALTLRMAIASASFMVPQGTAAPVRRSGSGLQRRLP